jgi:hypothetical protein
LHDKATAVPSDDGYEEAVLRHVLDWQPTILRLSDVIREVSPDPHEFAHRDGVERAVRELVKVNLLHRHGDCVLPTSTAVYVRGMELR